MADLPQGAPILSVDFDGVIHSYMSGWKGPRNIPDAPVSGAIPWLRSLVDDQRDPFVPRFKMFDVRIFSSRARYWGGRSAMKAYLVRHGMRPGEVEAIKFPLFKPPSHLHIDDRAIQFTGTFPTVREIVRFTPWNRRKLTAETLHVYRKRPIDVEAWQWNFSPNQLENPGWVTGALFRWPKPGSINFYPDGTRDAKDGEWASKPHIAIQTLESTMRSVPGDWIIQGVAGEIYACKPDIFAQTYFKP